MRTNFVDDCIAAVWGMVLLASWLGWGEAVRRLARVPARAAGVGLVAGWGMAAILAIGGCLQVASACNDLALASITWVGAAFAVLSAARWRGAILRPRVPWRAILPAGCVLAILYVLSVHAAYLNNWDDYPAYLVFPKDLLQNGMINQPYSLRRLLTFGGQAQLDAMLLLHASIRNIDILEVGLCRVVVVALVVGAARPRGRLQQLLAGSFAVVLALVARDHLPSENTHSEMTTLVLFLTVVRTLGLAHRHAAWRLAAVAAMAAAGAATMRVSNLPAAVFMIAFYYLGRMLLDRKQIATHAGRLLLAAVAFGVVLLPWSLVLYKTSGTLLNPMWLGTQNPDYGFLSRGLPWIRKAAWIVGFFGYPGNSPWDAPMQVLKDSFDSLVRVAIAWPLLFVLTRRHWRTELPLAIAAVITAVMILVQFTLGEYHTMYRYIFPILFSVTAIVLYRTLVQPQSAVRQKWAIAALALAAVAFVPAGAWWVAFQRPFVPGSWRVSMQEVEAARPEYLAAQAAVPYDKKIYSATSLPMHFDFARNPILIADVPGAASPPPGMPLFAGRAAMEHYLIDQGIDYVIYSDDDIQNMYNRKYWEDIRHKTGDNTPDIENVQRFYYAFLAALDEMGEKDDVRYRGKTLTVVHLKAP